MTSAPALIASASIVVEAPASVVFDILADPRQHTRVDGSSTVQGVVDGPQRLTLGSTFTTQVKRGLGYRTTNKVVEYEPDALIAWRHRGAHRWRWEIEPEGDPSEGKVRVTETWDGTRYTGMAKAIFTLLGLRKTQESIEESLVLLKAAAENDAARA